MALEMTLECLDCGARAPYSPSATICPRCGGPWREMRYDLETLSRIMQPLLEGREFELWRYRELLPVRGASQVTSMGEGGTPLIHATALGMMLGCPNIYIKDERQGPTGSFKDRQAAVGVAALKEAGLTEVVIASTGNVAIAYSAYAARAGIKLWAFLTSMVPAEKMREVAIYGTQVIKVTASYDQTKLVAAEFARQHGITMERGIRTVASLESMKTIAFEICEQLTSRLGAPNSAGRPFKPWRAPDWYFQSVSGGVGPLGVLKGFDELAQMRWIDHLPALACIQAEGCAPMVSAWKAGQETAEPVRQTRTRIATLATGDPGRTYTLLAERMKAGGGGVFEAVTDEETYRAMHILAKMEGISVEPAAGVAFAGLIKLVRLGRINPEDTVVVNCTGHTMPIETTILGDDWSRDVVLAGQPGGEVPQEGLLAALNHASAERYPSVEIVDDNADARRLFRRILQAQGEYRIIEASDGVQAVEMAERELPDLLVLDLMMPGLDGFAVLDRLKANPGTAHIPVIVVTAKDLTTQEKERLKGQIHSLRQKGEFMNDELMEEVKALLN